ncbi:MAG: hypothetical protein Q8P23_00385 [bacterium]|nr:hypothetical protein [bacterium]
MNLSYLMGGKDISDADLKKLGIEVVSRKADGNRKLRIPDDHLAGYKELMKAKLEKGFWNEIVGETQILFIFKFNDGAIKELELSPPTEQEIDVLCAQFNNESPDKTANVYKYISENSFYHDFMLKYYADMIDRP